MWNIFKQAWRKSGEDYKTLDFTVNLLLALFIVAFFAGVNKLFVLIRLTWFIWAIPALYFLERSNG